MLIALWFYGFTVSGFRFHGVLVLWVNGFMVLRFHGFMVLWFLVLWFYGLTVACFYGFVVLWFHSFMFCIVVSFYGIMVS